MANTIFYTYQTTYRIQYATGIRADLTTREAMAESSRQRLLYLGRKLIEELGDGERIVTIRRELPLQQSEIDALSQRLRDLGSCRLLIVEEAADEALIGRVNWIAPGVMRGYVRAFADGQRVVETVEVGTWLALCRKAYDLCWLEAATTALGTSLPDDFDPVRYLALNEDVAQSRMDPRYHYMAFGALEGRPYRAAAASRLAPVFQRF